MQATSLDFIDITSNALINSETNKVIFSELKSRLTDVDIADNPLHLAPIPSNKPTKAALACGRIYKVSKVGMHSFTDSKNPPIPKINTFDEYDASKCYRENKVSPSKVSSTKKELPLLAELEELYQNRCKSNISNKRTSKVYSEIKSIQGFSPLNSGQFTPSRPIWSRWGKPRTSIPSPSELKAFH
jgi:hypothetical protein